MSSVAPVGESIDNPQQLTQSVIEQACSIILGKEKQIRLALACLVASGCNFLLLDEPVNHLDIPSRARFEAAIASYEGTVLAVVHDRYFIEGFASEIWEIEKNNEAATGSLKTWIV